MRRREFLRHSASAIGAALLPAAAFAEPIDLPLREDAWTGLENIALTYELHANLFLLGGHGKAHLQMVRTGNGLYCAEGWFDQTGGSLLGLARLVKRSPDLSIRLDEVFHHGSDARPISYHQGGKRNFQPINFSDGQITYDGKSIPYRGELTPLLSILDYMLGSRFEMNHQLVFPDKGKVRTPLVVTSSLHDHYVVSSSDRIFDDLKGNIEMEIQDISGHPIPVKIEIPSFRGVHVSLTLDPKVTIIYDSLAH